MALVTPQDADLGSNLMTGLATLELNSLTLSENSAGSSLTSQEVVDSSNGMEGDDNEILLFRGRSGVRASCGRIGLSPCLLERLYITVSVLRIMDDPITNRIKKNLSSNKKILLSA